MNRLSTARRALILEHLVEGCSVRATARLERVSPVTVLKLLADAGEAAADFHHEAVRGVPSAYIECDELWAPLYAKAKNVDAAKAAPPHAGSVWTWTALDTVSKLIVSWQCGGRDMVTGQAFMDDLRLRVKGRPQITTDGWQKYPEIIEEAFGAEVDYAMLLKQYDSRERYVGAQRFAVAGNPDMARCSTSLVERHNLTMRTQLRRYTREASGHSKKWEKHLQALAFWFTYYNWVRPHQTLRGSTPAHAAGLAPRRYKMGELMRVLKL
ncbi:MAG: integrase core domain-containing protein [Chloroflexi bacterium]|nr:integrase core domain-containing protein [Chloroflexota bacterium]